MDGYRIKAPLDYSRGPEKTWVYGVLRVRDGKELTQCAASRNSTNYIALLGDIESDNATGDIFIITDNLSSHNSAQTRVWLAKHPGSIRSSFPLGRAGSTCKRAGGVSSDAMLWLDRVLPTLMRLSRLLVSRQLSSTDAPNRGSGDVLPRIIATIAASFVIAFKERSSRSSYLSNSSSSVSSRS